MDKIETDDIIEEVEKMKKDSFSKSIYDNQPLEEYIEVKSLTQDIKTLINKNGAHKNYTI